MITSYFLPREHALQICVTHLLVNSGLLQPQSLLLGLHPVLPHLQYPGYDPGLLAAPHLRVGVKHGSHQRRPRPWHSSDEYQRHEPVVAVHLVVLAHYVRLQQTEKVNIPSFFREDSLPFRARFMATWKEV